MPANKFLVGMQGEKIVFPLLGLSLSEDEALELAARIVAIVCDDEKWEKILAEVKNT